MKPTFVFQKDGRLEPVFVIGWMNLVLTDYQQRLLATIIHDAILTLEDFQGSDATIIFVPRTKWSKTERCVKSWKVSDQRFLTKEELQAQFDRFGKVLDDAVPLILEELIRRGKA